MSSVCLPCRLCKAYAALERIGSYCVLLSVILLFFWSVFSCIQNVFSSNTGKYGAEKTPYLDTFQVVLNTMLLTLSTEIWSFKFQLEHFPRNTRFFSFDEKHFRDQGNVRRPISKLIKCDLVQTLNTSRDLLLRIFAAGRHLLFLFVIRNEILEILEFS